MKHTPGFTPGPWTMDGYYNSLRVHRAGEKPGYTGRQIAEACHFAGFPLAEAQANACLIAAAPELLEQCQRLLNIVEADAHLKLRETYGFCISESKAAIAKAKGE